MFRVGSLLLLALFTMAGCGGGASSPAGSAGSSSQLFVSANAADLVLKANQVGHGWLTVPDQTHEVSVEDAMKGDPPAIKALEKPAYRSGYQGLYIDSKSPQHNGALVGAFTFQNQAVASQVVDAWTTHSAKGLQHAQLLHPPAGAPGDRISGFEGMAPQNGKLVPMCFVMWSHGNAIGGIFLFGKDAKVPRLYQLATAEDARITRSL
jgi:hypothetical protein